MEEVGAVVLQVDALAGRVGGDEDPQRVLLRVAVEGALDLLAVLVADPAVELADPRLGPVGAGDRPLELLEEVLQN